jgi:CheY-like chemotaxis protein
MTQNDEKSLRILVVEDDLPTLELMQEVLSSFGLDVVTENDSERASLRISREKFDGIFLDLMMPKLTGFQLAREVRLSQRNRSTTIIIVTANDDKKTMEEAFSAGGGFFLSKPIDRRRLTILLNSTRGTMLESRRRVRRVPVKMPVSCNASGKSFTLVSYNLSEQGMQINPAPSLTVGAELKLSFCLPGQHSTIVANALVVRIDDNGQVGLHLSAIRQTDRQRIRLYLDEKYPEEEDRGRMPKR